MEYYYFIFQLLLSALVGGIIGWERVHSGSAAGPRTYALVCLGSTLFTVLSVQAFGADTARIAAQILTGIGFLGAGIIMHQNGGVILGLTTAAGLWVCSAIGMAIGVFWIWQAIATALIVFFIMALNDTKFYPNRKKKKINKIR